jgi:predicted AAA+ superfamily ATPase
MSKKEKIAKFYRFWMSQIDKSLSVYKKNKIINSIPAIYIFYYYLKLLEKFLGNKIENIQRINMIWGVKEEDKKAILAHLYYLPKTIPAHKKDRYKNIISQKFEKIYLDVSRLSSEVLTLKDFFNYYQEKKKNRFSKLNKKLLILLYEIHYDKKFQLFLKNIFDSTEKNKNILIIATFSSDSEKIYQPKKYQKKKFYN